MKPLLLIITGAPGSGKTTLSETLSRTWHLPLLSRDRIKEGFVHTAGAPHDQLPDGNRAASEAFFAAVELFADQGISCIAEAAFQHKVWDSRLMALQQKADVRVLICASAAAAERYRSRRVSDPSRVYFHGDPSALPAAYDPPHGPYPVYTVDTTDGYTPSLEDLRRLLLNRA